MDCCQGPFRARFVRVAVEMTGRRRSCPVMKSLLKMNLGPTRWTVKDQLGAFTRLRSGVRVPLRPPTDRPTDGARRGRSGSSGRRSGCGPRHDPAHSAEPGRHADASGHSLRCRLCREACSWPSCGAFFRARRRPCLHGVFQVEVTKGHRTDGHPLPDPHIGTYLFGQPLEFCRRRRTDT
jgi:hypothetical protein